LGGFVPYCDPRRIVKVAKKEMAMPTTRSSSIDLTYRPENYFWAHDKKITLSSDIKGAERKALYEKLVAVNETDLASTLIKEPTLTLQDRESIGQIHPRFMGGEYLPDRLGEEVEIARITIASTTQDVTCVYAKRGKNRIYYRVVDEYDGDTLNNPNRTSNKPLTLKQLTDFFISSWDLLACLDANFEYENYPRDEVHEFIVDASSSFYAEFGSLIHERISAWLDEKHASLGFDEEDAED
jgi:hypothetical protein